MNPFYRVPDRWGAASTLSFPVSKPSPPPVSVLAFRPYWPSHCSLSSGDSIQDSIYVLLIIKATDHIASFFKGIHPASTQTKTPMSVKNTMKHCLSSSRRSILFYQSRGWPIRIQGPNLAHCLFWEIKFHWNTATSLCWCILQGCFCATLAAVSSWAEPTIFTSWPFTGKVCPPRSCPSSSVFPQGRAVLHSVLWPYCAVAKGLVSVLSVTSKYLPKLSSQYVFVEWEIQTGRREERWEEERAGLFFSPNLPWHPTFMEYFKT